jgi:PKD repeat protein
MRAMNGTGRHDRGIRARARIGNAVTGMAATAATMLAVAAFFTGSAGAVTGGQIGEAWGKPGSAAGQLTNPGMLGVDSSDGSVYSGEEKDEAHYRLQKFTSSGEFKAGVEVARKEGEIVLGLRGIAVDPTMHRIYVMQSCHLKKPATTCKLSSTFTGATRILVFSTEPSGTALVAGSPATLSLPSGEEAIYEPQTIAVDPSTHDLVILGENVDGHLLVQRISSAGAAGARYVDTGDELRSPGQEVHSLAVGPDGTTYMLTGAPGLPGAQSTRAWQMPPSLAQVEPVPGFVEAAESEDWSTGLLSPINSSFVGGPQLTVSPDGGTLYWKESVEQPNLENAPGNVLVRGFSLAKDETTALYGNGSNAKKRCLIQTPEAGIAAVGENLVVFDYGPGEELTTFGNRVMTFGPGGTECRSPLAKFTANGKAEGEEVSVEKGVQVSFDATSSELLGLAPNELDWDFGDGSEEQVTGSPAVKTVKHTFASAGTYRVTLRMKLTQGESANFGNPLPVTRLVKVTGGSLNKLTVSKTGSGSGSVTSSPAGVACGPDCDQEYEAGKEVTLTASAAAGSKVSGWSGSGCAGTGTCKVTMSEAKAVTATFAPVTKRKLTVVKEGSGSGVVTSVPSGIDCRSDCEQEYEEGREVTLKAVPVTGSNSKFSGWSGACAGTETCKVTMSEARTVKATFAKLGELFSLKVKILGNGAGKVASIPSGVLCEPTCEHEFAQNAEIELVQGAEGNSTFVKWGGACSGSGTCKVTMTESKEVTAEFTDPGPFKLKVTKLGSAAASGKVTSTPAGISCSPTCEAEFDSGKEVTLEESVTGGEAEFVKWGGACAGSGACKVMMSAAKEVTAEFKSTVKPKFKLKVTKLGSGSGTISGPGISCPGDCEEEFTEGTAVELTAAPGGEAEFVKWGGACTGSGACKVTMSAAREVSGEFKSTVKPKFKLKVLRTGTAAASGKVTSTPVGISCAPTCEAEYESGTEVTLAESVTGEAEFVKWGGACTGSGACKVTMSAAKEVTAEFKAVVKSKFKLTVTRSGDGSGTVSSGDGQIDCGADCEGEYESGAKVTLTATPASGSEFKGWNGACSGAGPCEVAMTAAKLVGAEFASVPTGGGGGGGEEVKKPPLTPLKKAIAKCKKKFKGKARAKCIAKAKKKFGKHKRRAHLRAYRDRG